MVGGGWWRISVQLLVVGHGWWLVSFWPLFFVGLFSQLIAVVAVVAVCCCLLLLLLVMANKNNFSEPSHCVTKLLSFNDSQPMIQTIIATATTIEMMNHKSLNHHDLVISRIAFLLLLSLFVTAAAAAVAANSHCLLQQ